MPIIPSINAKTSVGTPTYEYESMTRLWKRSRAIMNGELYAKEHDRNIDTINYTNLLVPFSPRMTQEQYRWYVAEAELPGLVSQYARTLAGGLLRKEPSMTLPDGVPDEAHDWLRSRFTQDGRSMVAFLDDAIWEELVTSRAFVSVDFPKVDNYDSLSTEQRDNLFPYPVLWRAEDVINWQVGVDVDTGRPKLTRVVFRYIDRSFSRNPHHADLEPTVADHYIDDEGIYRVQYYQKEGESSIDLVNGDLRMTELFGSEIFSGDNWFPVGELLTPKLSGEPMRDLPIFPLNGEIQLETPLLNALVSSEVALFNKVSRRNHLLYGASTYTPVIFSDMTDEDFAEIVNSGLGSWIKLRPEDKIDTLRTPTDSLADMDRAIESSISSLARMGIRLMSPETNQSGVALEIRNSSQTAQLGLLNTKISSTMKAVIRLMLRWKYGADLDVTEVKYTLSTDFNAAPMGPEWLRVVYEWYEARAIPRSVFIQYAKQHDVLPPDYDDEAGLEEIGQDNLTGGAFQPTINEQGVY